MKYIKLFEKFNFDELAILSELEKAILHIVRVHEKAYYDETKISDEFMFRRDIKDLIQMGLDKKGFELNPRKYPKNPNMSKGLTADHILATISDYQYGMYGEDKLGIDSDDAESSLIFELVVLLEPLQRRTDDVITSSYFITDLTSRIKDAMAFTEDGIYQRIYK